MARFRNRQSHRGGIYLLGGDLRGCVYCSAMFTIASKLVVLPLLALTPILMAQNTPAAPSAPASPTATTGTANAVKIDHQDSFLVVGVTVRTNNETEAGGQGKIPQLWERVMEGNALDRIPNRVGEGMVVVYSNYASDNTGDYDYTLGARVSSADKLPDGYVVRTIQAGRYAVVSSAQGPPEEVIPALWQRIARMTPTEMGGTRAYRTDFETYAPFTDPSVMQVDAHVGLK